MVNYHGAVLKRWGEGECEVSVHEHWEVRVCGTEFKTSGRDSRARRPLTEEVVEVAVNTGEEDVQAILAVLRRGKELRRGTRWLASDHGVVRREDAFSLGESKQFG
jgi:hypothetical protein